MAVAPKVGLKYYTITINGQHQEQHHHMSDRNKSHWNCKFDVKFKTALIEYVSTKIQTFDLEVDSNQSTLYIYDSINQLTKDKNIADLDDFTVQITMDHTKHLLDIHAYPDNVKNGKYGWAYAKSRIKDFCNSL